MAASSNTTWCKGFSGNPDSVARGDAPFAGLVSGIGGEWVGYPMGGEDALSMTRREALARTLWTRAVIDGDTTAIKLLVELLEDKAVDEAGAPLLDADQFARAEAILKGWEAGRVGDASTGDEGGAR